MLSFADRRKLAVQAIAAALDGKPAWRDLGHIGRKHMAARIEKILSNHFDTREVQRGSDPFSSARSVPAGAGRAKPSRGTAHQA